MRQNEQDGDAHGTVRRSGRRQGYSSTREDIIRSAQKLFAERGFRGATMRAIAMDARVDAALIHHFFTSKEGVFSAAVGDAFRPGQILEAVLPAGPGEVGGRLVRAFLALWDDPKTRDPMLAVVRSAVSYDDAARLVSDFVTTQVIGHVVKLHAASDKELRTTLIGSQVIGMLMVRYVIKIEPLSSLAPDAVSALLGPVIDRYLIDDLDVPEGACGLAGRRRDVSAERLAESAEVIAFPQAEMAAR
jgi:AcrR family transcriptional regulator